MRFRSAGTGSLETKEEDVMMKYRKAAAAILAAGIMIAQAAGNVYLAQETEQEQQTTEMATVTTQDPAPQTEAPAVQPETSAPQTEAPAPQPETPVPQTEAPAPQTEAPAPQTEAPTPQTEAPTPQTEVPAPQENSPAAPDNGVPAPVTDSAKNNHSTAIPENPTEGRVDQEIVDAGEVDGGEDMETDEEQMESDPDAVSYTGENSDAGRSFRDFRFTQVDKKPATTTQDFSGLIREDASENSAAVGKIPAGGIVYLLAKKNDWYFVESGEVRGFICEKNLLMDDEIVLEDDTEDAAAMAEAVSFSTPADNDNYTYTYTTVHEVLAGKHEALMIRSGVIYEYADDRSRPIGVGTSGCLVYVLAAGTNGWYFVESDNVRGFIRYDNLLTGSAADTILENEGEGSEIYADELVAPQENRSLYFTLLSVRESSAPAGSVGYTQEQLELIWAIVAQEDNGSYEGALAVISSAVNRCESPTWGYLGSDPLTQLTAPGQYCYSLDDYWRPRLGGNVPDYVKQAVEDCLVRGIRNHTYTSFRSTKGKTTGNDAVQIGGNWFFGS